MPLAIFGISSSGLSIFINLLVLFLVLVYVALVYWTYLDAKKRLEDPVLIACATAAALFPFIGPIVYTILRPPEFLADVHERDLEIRASELRVRQLIEQSCPHCEYPIENDYIRCPNCERRLKSPCRSCRRPLDPKWGVCPYCETEVQKQKPAEDRRPDRGDRAARRAERQRATQRSSSGGQLAGGGQPNRPGQSTRPAPQRRSEPDPL
ncbi:MAG: zinc ribbon domain-containing protein [Solirubrobacterales bacterium]